MQLLPQDFDLLVDRAVETFWASRGTGSQTQGGARGNVISGKNLDGFLEVVRAVAGHAGIPEMSIYTAGRAKLTLPGYYRAQKNWDVLIVHRDRLLAVLEFKSQVGSFGNNFNNRSEEVIGSASDFSVAAQKGAYHPANHRSHRDTERTDPRAPFLGYLMLLQDCQKSTTPVRCNSPHYGVFPEFEGTSYADRYRILCERLMEQKLYSVAALMMSPEPAAGATATWSSMSEATTAKGLFTELAGRLHAAVQY